MYLVDRIFLRSIKIEMERRNRKKKGEAEMKRERKGGASFSFRISRQTVISTRGAKIIIISAQFWLHRALNLAVSSTQTVNERRGFTLRETCDIYWLVRPFNPPSSNMT